MAKITDSSITTHGKNTTPTILAFAQDNANDIWKCMEHRKRSLAKISRFSEFFDHSIRPISGYSPKLIYNFLRHLSEDQGKSDGTQNRYIAAVSKVFKHYGNETKTDINPHIVWRKDKGGRPRFFSPEEEQGLINVLNATRSPWSAHLTTILLKTGMRLSEVVNIGLSVVEVAPDAVYGSLSADRRTVHLFRTKNGSDRDIPLSEEAFDALEALNFKPSLFFSRKAFYAAWHIARRKLAPNDKYFVPHCCRHTCCTKLASLGFNLKQIGNFVGHKSESTTAKYVHRDEGVVMKMIGSL